MEEECGMEEKETLAEGWDLAQKLMEFQDMVLRHIGQSAGQCLGKNGKQDCPLTRVQLRIIKTLSLLEKPTLVQMEKILATSKSSLSITLSRLEEKGYVRRQQDAQNGRLVYWYPTEKGAKLQQETEQEMMHLFAVHHEAMEPEVKLHIKEGIEQFYLAYQCANQTRRTGE